MSVRSKAEFADVLSEAVKDAGFTDATELAKVTDLNPNTVRTWLRGDFEPRLLQFAKLARVVGISLDVLAYNDAENVSNATNKEIWSVFNDGQRAALRRAMRGLAELCEVVGPGADPVAMFVASVDSTVKMCDTFKDRVAAADGSLPLGTQISVDKTDPKRPIKRYDAPPRQGRVKKSRRKKGRA